MVVTGAKVSGASKNQWANVSPVLTLEQQKTKNNVNSFCPMSSFPSTFQLVVPNSLWAKKVIWTATRAKVRGTSKSLWAEVS